MRALTVLLLATVVVASCAPSSPRIDIADGTLELAVTDPALVDAIATYIAIMIPQTGDEPLTCEDYLEMSIDELVQARSLSTGSAAQAFTVGGDDACVDELYVFGNVDSPGSYSYLLLGSTQPCDAYFGAAQDDVAAAEGSVIAIGCRDREIAAGESVNLKITLFPSGLR